MFGARGVSQHASAAAETLFKVCHLGENKGPFAKRGRNRGIRFRYRIKAAERFGIALIVTESGTSQHEVETCVDRRVRRGGVVQKKIPNS